MLHGGMDFLYSKGGKNNSYLDGETNKLPYSRQRFFSSTHAYCREWILFRQTELGKRLLCLASHPKEGFYETWSSDGALALLINADQSLGSEQLLFAVNPDFNKQRFEMGAFDLTGFKQWADHERFVTCGLASAAFYQSKGWIELPGLTCGLWISDKQS
jgi:pullulanase/glycogen debranching enzyme